VDEVGRFNAALREHHWLGHRLTGQVLRYVAVLDGEWVAVVGFGSAVLSCRARDEFVGWSREQQYARLRHVANNQRFCVLPAGRRPTLASVVLSRVLARLSRSPRNRSTRTPSSAIWSKMRSDPTRVTLLMTGPTPSGMTCKNSPRT
jgi:hypothetical protein